MGANVDARTSAFLENLHDEAQRRTAPLEDVLSET
jgi:hypothetical protein